MVSISYAILVNDELKEIKELCSLLINYKHPEDEIIIVQDVADVEDCSDSKLEVYEYLMNLSKDELIKYYQRPLNNNFAEQKNYLNSKCSKDYIFNLDADEIVSQEFIAEYIKQIIELNSEVEAFWLHRVNIVDDITLRDINNWGWSISKLENYTHLTALDNLPAESLELLEHKNLIISKSKQHNNITYYRPIVNWPMDPQLRLYKNISTLKWERPVHEYLTGYNTISRLPAEPALSIIHSKHINKQRNQNKYYSDIINLKL